MAHAVALNVGAAVRVAGAGVDVAAAGVAAVAPPVGAGAGLPCIRFSSAEFGDTLPRGIAEFHCS